MAATERVTIGYGRRRRGDDDAPDAGLARGAQHAQRSVTAGTIISLSSFGRLAESGEATCST